MIRKIVEKVIRENTRLEKDFEKLADSIDGLVLKRNEEVFPCPKNHMLVFFTNNDSTAGKKDLLKRLRNEFEQWEFGEAKALYELSDKEKKMVYDCIKDYIDATFDEFNNFSGVVIVKDVYY